MRGYSITSFGGHYWLVTCHLCHHNNSTAAVRDGLESVFEWIQYHEDHQDEIHKGK